ncbi:putative major myo-inositol transporter iolT [Coleophoma crateriformis]|uniref:Putative major myo-inositol transporter iolT n=1 Tax=Coleophoma crateriformis TaxID=565419 RepID=A0A3D8SYG9_9HELO|nr:putative major myo-inositol transporter iolT [Coleophoma crateriformis]
MPNPPSRMKDDTSLFPVFSKKHEIVAFSSTAIALYGYDQGMMSLINTNRNYLQTMKISEESPIVGIIVSVYYLGCAVGSVVASWLADKRGRKPSIFACLATTSFGNILMFISGLSMNGSSAWDGYAIVFMLLGRIIMGLGVGGIDAVIPVYSSELASDGARGRALAQEFQMNIFGLLMAFSINLGVTIGLGKDNQWAWRLPIIIMQIFPVLLMSLISRLPETPRWFMSKERRTDAGKALESIYGKQGAKSKLKELDEIQDNENDEKVGYKDMLLPGGSQFHPTMVTIMGQINQALTGYGAVSVYGPQIFELLGFSVRDAEYLTLGNYFFYFGMMTLAWMSIDVLGRRRLMLWGSMGLAGSFALLTLFGGLSYDFPNIPSLAVGIPGSIILYLATAIFGIGWLATVWLIPTEIYPSTARAQGSAISVIVWGLANFTVTLLAPIGFNNLKYWLFLVFAATNTFAGWWTWKYSPESGGRSFEENQEFFISAVNDKSWSVKKVDGGKFLRMPGNDIDTEREPLLRST